MHMIKRVFRAAAVLGMLAALLAAGIGQGEAEALQTAGRVDTESELLEETFLQGNNIAFLGKLNQQVRLPEKPDTNEPEEEPVMGAVFPADKPYLVGVDPGHLGYTAQGYFNPGAVSVYGTPEYEWTMKIGKLLTEELTARGYDVYLLRNTNDRQEYPYTSGHRAEAANDMECDILVAIHWDSHVEERHSGYHAIYRGDKNSAAYRLAKAVSDAYFETVNGVIAKRTDPVDRTDLWELNDAQMPAMILECGFSSNRQDATWLENEENHAVIAQAIADGIDRYFAGEEEAGRAD